MRVSLQEVSEIQKRLEVTVPAEEVRHALEEIYGKIGQEAKIKGFRPGKVPRPVLEQYYKQDAESEAIRHLIGESYPAAVEETGILPVSMPQVTVKAFGGNQDLVYDALVEIRPKIEAQGYKGIKLTKEKIVATEEEIEQQLKTLQERATQLVPTIELRPCREQDVVVIDYKGLGSDGRPLAGVEAKDYMTELGRQVLLPEFETGLLGMKAGEKKKLHVTFPPETADKKFAGKTIAYEVHLKEIKEKKVPELTDDFAKDIGNFQSLNEVKEKIREHVVADKEQAARGGLRRQIIEQLVKANKFEVPQGMVQEELEASLHRLESNLKNQGMTLEQVGITREDYFEKNRNEALLRVQGDLLFDAIAEKEGISVTDEMVDHRIEEMATQAGAPPDEWKRYYREKNQTPVIKMVLRGEKTLDFVLAEAKIKVKE